MRMPLPTRTRQNLLCAAALGLVVLTAPFPRLQAVAHALLVVAFAPRAGEPLQGALWAVAAGWALEGTLRLYPHLGGTAWADLSVTLLAGWVAGHWPVEGLRTWLVRLGWLTLLQGLLVHGAVRLAAGPHAWGSGWFWALILVPAWGWAAWRLLHAGPSLVRR